MLSLKWYSIMFLALLVILPIQGVVYAESFTPVSLMSTVAPAVSNIKWIGENKKFPEPGSVNLVVFWNGVYSSSIKALAFAEKIQEILADENLQSQFGAFNKNRSMDYTVDKVKDQLKEIYNQMLSEL